MPRRELLTEPQQLAFTEPATDEREMVRHYTLSPEDLILLDRRLGDPNRLGFAVMLCYLRFPGRTLRQDEQPPATMLAFVAEQLSIDPASFADYADRDKTRRSHVAEIQTAIGYRIFNRTMYRDMSAWLLPTALATEKQRAPAYSVVFERQYAVISYLSRMGEVLGATQIRKKIKLNRKKIVVD